MRYIIDTRYRLRGWHGAPTGVYDTRTHEAHFVAPALYKLVMRCDAAQDIDPEALSEKEGRFLKELSQAAGGWEFHTEGKYHTWLNGYEVKCPFCGNASPDVVKRIGASPSEVAFICDACVKSFFLRWNRLYNKVNVITY